MRKIPESTPGRTDGAWNRYSQIKGLTRVFGMLLCAATMPAMPGFAATVTLEWNRSSTANVTGYRIYYGVASGSYLNSVIAGNVTSNSISGLTDGVTYFFAVKAISPSGVESLPSNEIIFVPGRATVRISLATNRQVILTVKGSAGRTYEIQTAPTLANWVTLGTVTLGTNGTADFKDPNTANLSNRFYRTRDIQP